MVRVILALPEAQDPGNQHAAEGRLDHGSSMLDDRVTDQKRPVKTNPRKKTRAA
jgi:hypothetical protein